MNLYPLSIIGLLFYIILLPYFGYCQLTAVPTFENMGLEFNALKPTSKNDTAYLKYRMTGSDEWKEALSLYLNEDINQYAGSVVNLQPATQYEFKVTMKSGETATVRATTWNDNFPVGETVYLPKFSNQTLIIRESGSPGAYKKYTFDPAIGSATLDGQDTLDYNIEIADGIHHIIIDGLLLKSVIQNNILLGDKVYDIVIQNNELTKWGRNPHESPDPEGAISDKSLPSDIERIIIQGNYIHTPNFSSWTWETEHPQGPSGIMFRDSKGNHVIRYNTIQGTDKKYLAYGIRGSQNYSYLGGYGYNTDIYGNYISRAWAAGIECEGGNKNNRIYKNFIENTFSNINISVVSRGPLYIFQNITGLTRRSAEDTNSDTWGASAFLKIGGNDLYEVKRIYLFNNVNLQPPPVGGGTDYGCGASNGWSDSGAQSEHGEPQNLVALNNIFLRRTGNANHSIGELKSGSECSNIIDYNMFLGSLPENCAFQKHGIFLSSNQRPKWDPENGSNSNEFLDRQTLEGKFFLTAGAPGQGDGTPIPNFLDGESVDMGPHQRGAPSMKFGARSLNRKDTF